MVYTTAGTVSGKFILDMFPFQKAEWNIWENSSVSKAMGKMLNI